MDFTLILKKKHQKMMFFEKLKKEQVNFRISIQLVKHKDQSIEYIKKWFKKPKSWQKSKSQPNTKFFSFKKEKRKSCFVLNKTTRNSCFLFFSVCSSSTLFQIQNKQTNKSNSIKNQNKTPPRSRRTRWSVDSF